MTHQQQNQNQKTAQASCKAKFEDQTEPKAETQQAFEFEKVENMNQELAGELNTYEARVQAKRERYQKNASKAQEESYALLDKAHDMAKIIPFGQPILIGHHSERRDRNYRNKIHNTFGRAFAAKEKAEYYADKAESVGTGGISSDDPDAIKKLRTELEKLEAHQAYMKTVNKIVRANKTPETRTAALIALGFSEEQAIEAITPDACNDIGFPRCYLTNNNAKINRINGRIAELERNRQRVDSEVKGDGFVCRQDTKENRLMFIFEGKPDEATRKLLKSKAFKWSPTRGAWVRQLNNAGIWAAKELIKQLNAKH